MSVIKDGRGSHKTLQSNKIREKILKFVTKNPGETKLFYSEKIGVSRPTLSKHLKSLSESGELEI